MEKNRKDFIKELNYEDWKVISIALYSFIGDLGSKLNNEPGYMHENTKQDINKVGRINAKVRNVIKSK